MSKNLKNQYANFLDAVEKVVANAKTRKSLTSFPDDVMTGFRHLDKILCGFQRGEVIVIGGKPKMGKNALALSIVSNLCKKGMPVLLFSLMDTKTMVATKMMASQCMITINNLLQGNLVEEEWVAFEQNAGKLSDYPLIINDDNKLDITDIEDEVTRAVKNSISPSWSSTASSSSETTIRNVQTGMNNWLKSQEISKPWLGNAISPYSLPPR